MRKIHYSGGELITSEAVAQSVLEYAAALGNRGQAATIDVPAVGLPRGAKTVELLVGPASQLAAEPVDAELEVLDDEPFLLDIQERISRWTLTRPWTGEDWSLEL